MVLNVKCCCSSYRLRFIQSDCSGTHECKIYSNVFWLKHVRWWLRVSAETCCSNSYIDICHCSKLAWILYVYCQLRRRCIDFGCSCHSDCFCQECCMPEFTALTWLIRQHVTISRMLFLIQQPTWFRCPSSKPYAVCQILRHVGRVINRRMATSDFTPVTFSRGHAVAQLVEALRYNSEGRGFDSQWCHWHNPSGRIMVLGSTQSLTEMSTKNISWGIKAAGA
jgi:hypothetical protein